MDFSVYSRRRIFRMPYLGVTESVGVTAVPWALITGPLYFWRKGAMVESLVLGVIALVAWAADADGHLDEIAGLIWLGAALSAPLLLAASYRRRGWVDISNPHSHAARDEIDAPDTELDR